MKAGSFVAAALARACVARSWYAFCRFRSSSICARFFAALSRIPAMVSGVGVASPCVVYGPAGGVWLCALEAIRATEASSATSRTLFEEFVNMIVSF